MKMKDLRWRLEYAIFRFVAVFIEILPARQTARMAEGMAWLMTRVLPKKLTRYHIAYDNIRHAFGTRYSPAEIDQIIYRMWVHLFRLIAEIIQFPRKLRLENCREIVVFRNRSAAVKALNSGRPVFLLGGHFGNWEASTATFGVFGFQMGVVARKINNPYLNRWFIKARELTGHRMLLKNGNWDGISDVLERGGNLGLLCDQDAGSRGIFVNFFGRPASTFRSLALMARESQALIVVGYGRRLPDDFHNSRWTRFEIGCEEVIDTTQIQSDDEVRTITELYTQALERCIERAPEQYFWVHRRWDSQPRKRAVKPASLKAAG